MAIRKIEILGADVLREETERVDSFDEELASLADDMLATMYHADGVGLAAPQIGLSLRICVVHARHPDLEEEPEPMVLVNPRVVESSEETDKAPEGCLSIPGVEEVVERPARVTIRAQDLQGEPFTLDADDFLARVVQHEIDHLDGVLFIDRLSPLKRKMVLKKWKKSRAEAEAETGVS